MTISELITHLTELREKHGDVEVYIDSDHNGSGYPIDASVIEFAEEIPAKEFNPKTDEHVEHFDAYQAELNEQARPPRILIGI